MQQLSNVVIISLKIHVLFFIMQYDMRTIQKFHSFGEMLTFFLN